MFVSRSLSAQMFELPPRRGVQGQGRVRGDRPLPPDQSGLHQASRDDHQVGQSLVLQRAHVSLDLCVMYVLLITASQCFRGRECSEKNKKVPDP